jgi:hypothetical protein
MQRVQHFLDYAATQEPAVTTYRASDMVLAIHSDAGYLNVEGARSRAGGHHFLSENVANPSNNGAIYNEASIIIAVMSSTAEAEIRALYINARKAVEVRNILGEMGHTQPPTPVQTDNSTAESIVNLRVQPKRTKAMDMHFHWLRNQSVNQKQFKFYWRPGTSMRADYWTKHHSPSHHCQIRNEILTPYQIVMDLYQLISNICIFEVTARHLPYIRIYDSFEEPYIRIYGFSWSFCNIFSQSYSISNLPIPTPLFFTTLRLHASETSEIRLIFDIQFLMVSCNIEYSNK